jgi:DNA ligase 1
MDFKTLYKRSSTGAIQTWSIRVEGATIITTWGQVGGAMQTTTDTISAGKNAGRSNATTPEQQAVLEAQSKWEKHLKKGYVETQVDAESGIVSDLIKGGIPPMLAHKYSEHGHKIRWPAFAQPKLDGHRCIAVVTGGHATLWSRTRKLINSMPHIIAALEATCDEVILDGELYNHDYRNNFEELTSKIRSATPVPGHEIVQYHIYDMACEDLEYSERATMIADLLLYDPLRPVQTDAVADEDELMCIFEAYRAAEYEGAIVRNASGMYVNRRSYDLLKIKEFDDAEFKVISVKEGRGKEAGHAIFVCTNGTTEFRAKLAGKQDELRKYWEHPETAVGRMLTVKYQGLTSANGVPRFPVALRFVD